MMLSRSLAGTLVALGTLSSTSQAQNVPVSELTAETEFEEPFSNVTGVRELSDGSVLVADRLERAVYKVNYETGQYLQMGDNGQGPGEYEQPMGLFPMANDTSLLIDMGNARSAVMDSYGDIVYTRNLMSDAGFMMPGGVDSAGRFLIDGSSMSWESTAAETEIPLMTFDRESEAIDTIATLNRIPPRRTSQTQRMQSSGGGAVQISGGFIPMPFNTPDRWVALPDGRVAIARFQEYRLDILGSDGSLTRGPLVDYEPLPVTRRDRDLWEESQSNRTAVMSTPNGSQTITLPPPDMSQVEFPEHFPPFTMNIKASPSGEVWVERYQHMDEDRPLFDVFDSQGRIIRQVRLPAGRTLMGLGDGVAYATYSDEDELQWLERYRLGGTDTGHRQLN